MDDRLLADIGLTRGDNEDVVNGRYAGREAAAVAEAEATRQLELPFQRAA